MDVQTITVVIAGISVVIGVINSIISSRRADQQRQMQLFTQIYSHFLDQDFARNWDNAMLVSKIDNFKELSDKMLSQLASYREPLIAFSHVSR